MLYSDSNLFAKRLPPHTGAWTLIELCVVLFIASLILIFAIPSWQQLAKRTLARQVSHDIQSAVAYARIQSQLRQQKLSICPPDGHWENGFRVIREEGGQACGQAKPLRVWGYKSGRGIGVYWHGFLSDRLTLSTDPRHWAVNGHFIIDAGNTFSQRLVVNRVGTVSIYP